uniref:Uncharacterized protein n=1 Tax=Romanomermis culicivorax TaxID=13658 RepID=A0A915I9H8_ROMCU
MLQNNFPFNFLPSTPPYGHHQFFHQASSSSSSSLNNAPPPRGFMDFLQQQNNLAAAAAAAASGGNCQLPSQRGNISPPTADARRIDAGGIGAVANKAQSVASNGRATSASSALGGVEERNGDRGCGIESPTTSSSSATNLSSNDGDSTPSPKRMKDADVECSDAAVANDGSVKDNNIEAVDGLEG